MFTWSENNYKWSKNNYKEIGLIEPALNEKVNWKNLLISDLFVSNENSHRPIRMTIKRILAEEYKDNSRK